MSVIQNKHLPMRESRRYAARHSQLLCSSCRELYHSIFFFLFLSLPVLEQPDFRAISKPIMFF